MRRFAALPALGALMLLAACGSGPASSSPIASRQPTDPRSVPTASLPAVLPSPIPASSVSGTNAAVSGTQRPTTYTVKAGDTLGGIAAQLGISLPALQTANPDVSPTSLKVGQELRIPAPTATATPSATATATAGRTATASAGATRTATPGPGAAGTSTATSTPGSGSGQTYAVQSGDTACKIASRFQVSIQELAEANGTTPTGLANLKIGQQLKLPPPTGSPPGC